MASPQNVELEAAKFLQKLIQESKDEPGKLATKLYVILQHMRSSGKERSMPYQVISRAMETVISQHGLDIEALKSSRHSLSASPQMGDCTTSQHTESFQAAGISTSTNTGMAEHDMSKSSTLASGKAVVGPSSGGHEYYQGSLTHRSNQSFNQESPSSLETRSANSQSQERRDSVSYSKQGNKKDGKKVDPKRKRGDSSTVMESHAEDLQKLDNNNLVNPRKGKMSKVDASGFLVRGADQANFNIAQGTSQMEHLPSSLRLKQDDQIQPHSSLYENHDLATKVHEQRNIDPFSAASSSPFEPSDDGRNPIIQETRVPRSAAVRDAGKSLVSRASAVPGAPFNEQQLKQLRAQCLVFLAFRNGLTPKQLHLEIALGNISLRDGSASGGLRQEPDQKGNSQPSNEPAGSLPATHLSVGEAKGPTMLENNRNFGIQMHQNAESRTIPPTELKNINSPSTVNLAASNGPGSLGRDNIHGVKTILASPQAVLNQQVNLETFKRGSFGVLGEAPGGSLVSSTVREHSKPVSGSNVEHQIVSGTDGYTEIPKEVPHEKSTDEEGEDESASIFLPPPKYTMLEKWVMDLQKRKFLVEQNHLLKQQKTEQRISRCFDHLKKTVSLSEDISAKTKSVIELKKLQLLALQRRLRSDFLGDFFKPIVTDMDNLRSFKKHRHGRRIKQIEKYEQKMKEERQKRIRERQKEFFSDIEVHKERLEDAFKAKRERLKGFNKYVKELHKRKERIHREKIDRIQREKITLLKINDVEGYLRMVQDAKSDRVKQLLKETEKYLQKLGSKLQDAKVVARSSEHDAEEMQTESFLENSETAAENDDESDQAKHYKESNEKYYLMAHSIKESIAEQPSMLHGGKLREYQMNGLRWLVSLYNNQLNGILADEMGLGKTVQVISLICYLMETKNDRGPFLVVVPSSVLPGWESEINFWAPAVHKIVYAGPPEERRRLFKEKIVHQKFNVLLTTYEYLMNKHDRPKLSKLHWHYIIIDEGHRIKNASCKLNADLKHYRSSHRLLLTGTPLQNNLEELWALLNFLLPSIFNSSEDFSQWFNKPFESNGDSSAEEALLSEEENLLIINRLHQVLRPFVLRRLKHKVENELPEKIERLVRCEPSAYQKLLMKRVEENLGSLGTSKARSVQNSVMELRNICNHPYLSQLHAEEVDNLIPKHYLSPIVRLCGKLEMLDRLLPKLKATDHRVLFFSTMTRLLDVMEEYLNLKHYRYLRLDGHTSGGDRGALIELFNQPNSPFFIFLLSIRAGGVGVNLQAADTVIIFDTDWNPQVDLQAQARAHRIGQKKDVLVLRFETVQTVEEQVRAAAEHKLGVANQSITAGFFDNNTSAEDRREYLESLLRECKKEEAAPVLDDDALNDLIARSESEIDIFESVDRKRREEEMASWSKLVQAQGKDVSRPLLPLPPRLVTHEDLKAFFEVMKVFETPKTGASSNVGLKRKSVYGGLDTQHYGRGKRAREVRSYEEQMTEEEFERMCQVDSPGSPNPEDRTNLPTKAIESVTIGKHVESSASLHSTSASTVLPTNNATTPAKRGRGRPKRAVTNISSSAVPVQHSPETGKLNVESQEGIISSSLATSLNSSPTFTSQEGSVVASPNNPIAGVTVSSQPNPPTASPATGSESAVGGPPVPMQEKGQRRKTRIQAPQDVIATLPIAGLTSNCQPSPSLASSTSGSQSATVLPSSPPPTQERGQRRRVQSRAEAPLENIRTTNEHPGGVASKVQPNPPPMAPPAAASQPDLTNTLLAIQEKPVATQERGRRRKTHSPMTQILAEAPRRRGRRKISVTDASSGGAGQDLKLPEQLQNKPNSLGPEATAATGSTGSAMVLVPESTSAGNPSSVVTGKEVDYPHGFIEGTRERVCGLPAPHASVQDTKSVISDNSSRGKQSTNSKIGHNVRYVASMMKEILSTSKTKVGDRPEGDLRDSPPLSVTGSTTTDVTRGKHSEDKVQLSASVVSATVNLPSESRDDQSGREAAGVHETMERKVALPFPKQVIEESLEEMPAVPPGFETPKRSLPQNQEGESFDHGGMNVRRSSVNVADDVKISATSAYNANLAIGLETVTLVADGKSTEVIDGVLNQDFRSEVHLRKDSSDNLIVESKTEALHAANSVEQNNDDPCTRVPASDGKSQVHPEASEEVHGEIQEVPEVKSDDVNLDHDVNDEEKVPSQQDFIDVLPTGEDDTDEFAKTSCEQSSVVQQPHRVDNTGADTAEAHCKSSSPEFGASLPVSVDKLSSMDVILTKEKSAANSPIQVAKSGGGEEEMGHQMDITHKIGTSVDMEESSEVADWKAATHSDSSPTLVTQVEKNEGLMEEGDSGSFLCEEGCQMDGSEANSEMANRVSENVNKKLAIPDYSVINVDSSSPLTAAGEKNDSLTGGGSGGNLLQEMGAQMAVFEQSNLETAEVTCVALLDESAANRDSNFIASGPDSLDMSEPESRNNVLELEEEQLALLENSTINGGSPMQALGTDPQDEAKPNFVNDIEDTMEKSEHQDNCVFGDLLDEGETKPIDEDMVKEQVDHPVDSICENSLDEAKSDTVDVVCEAKDVQMGLPESPPVATASNSTVPQPDISVEPNLETSKDCYAASEEQLLLLDDAMVAEESNLPVPQADFVTDAIQQTADKVSVDMNNQSPADFAVARNAQFHTSGAEYLDEVKLDIAPVSPAIQDWHENACSGQANERTALPEDSAGAVQSAANVPRNDSHDKVEVKSESLLASHALAELQGYASSDESNEEDHMNLSRSELVPEVNEVSELAEGNMALVEESAVAKQSKFIVPEADFLPKVKPNAAPAYRASHEMQESVASDHIHKEAPPPTILPECELGSRMSEVCVATVQLTPAEDSADVGQSKVNVPEGDMQEEVIPETAQTDHVIHAPQEHAGAGQVSEEALKTVLPGHDMGLDVVEAHVAVEQQLATPNDSPPAGESMSNMPVADLHDKATLETLPNGLAVHEQPIDASTDPVDEEAQCAIPPGCDLGSYTGEVCELVGEKLVLNEDSVGVETSRLDGDGRDAQNRVVSEEPLLVREDSVVPEELCSVVPGAEARVEGEPKKENAVCEIVEDHPVLLEDSVVAEESEELNSAASGAGSLDEVKIETVTEVLAIVEEHSLVEDKTAVPGELNPASAGVESQDEVKSEIVSNACEAKELQAVLEELNANSTVQPHDVNEISETVKELSPQLDDSAISEESKCDAVGDKSQGKVETMKVDEVGETVKQQQQMTQPEDSMVFEELKLTVPEAAALEVNKVEVDEVCKTVNEQQQMTQPEDSTASGESKLAVPEATSQNEVEEMEGDEMCQSIIEQEQMTQPGNSTVSGESKIVVPEAISQNEVKKMETDEVTEMVKEKQQISQSEDSTDSGDLKLAVPESTSQNEVERMEIDEVTEMVNEQQQMTQPEDSTVSVDLKLAVPEVTSQNEVEKMEIDEVIEMVQEQQQMTQPEDSTVSGELKLAVPEATSQNEFKNMEVDEVIKTVKGQQQMTQSEDSTVSGESKFVVPEATSQNEGETVEVDEVCETVKQQQQQQQQQISQSEDATVSGESKPPVPEAISKTEKKSDTMEETSDMREKQSVLY